ncbi:hypothetical protein UNPF46_19795 [Bradyrhizobium sp. UNPF46]|nr:hypothetical protein UNPF46_19795 [Bradyrhizobium sp. UNPF46]
MRSTQRSHHVASGDLALEELALEELALEDLALEDLASEDLASGDVDAGAGTCGTDGLPLRKRGCRSYQNTFAISARNQHASMSLSSPHPLTKRRGRDWRSLTLARSDARRHFVADRRDLFCIRLHFVLEERIGVEKIGAGRFLTIDEGARRNVFSGRRHNLRRQEFRHDRKRDDDLAAGFASKAVGGDRRHRLGASRACHAGRTLTTRVRSCTFAPQ